MFDIMRLRNRPGNALRSPIRQRAILYAQLRRKFCVFGSCQRQCQCPWGRRKPQVFSLPSPVVELAVYHRLPTGIVRITISRYVKFQRA